MCRLLESIYLCDGKFRNLHLHQERITRSAQVLFKQPLHWTLESTLMQTNIPTSGLFKARLVYDQEFVNVEFIPYLPKPIASLKLVEANFNYTHKFENRSTLDEVFNKRGSCDDVIIVQNGFVTDATYANLIFKKDSKWFTPTTCLLQGTMRTHLLLEGKIFEAKIQADHLHEYESCKLINALLGWDASEILITSIQ